MIDFRIRRVHVFLLNTLCACIQQSSTKGNHLTAHVEPGEDHATSISVVDTLFALDAETCLYQELLLISSLLGSQIQSIALAQRETKIKLLDNIIANASTTEILTTNGHTIRIVIQHILKVVHGPLVDDEHRLAIALLLFLLVR